MSKRAKKRRVMVVTGSRAEFGLLRPVMEAIGKSRKLELRVVVAGEHLLGPAHTWKEVAKVFRVDAKVGMQRAGDRGRVDHAAACARGMAGFAAVIKRVKPDWVVVLGDRIEAFAAASAASIGGVAVCHIHGGDRAEGIADEAMRHAITKMAHLHCAATKGSAERIRKMGEPAKLVHVTGSPAIDGLSEIPALTDAEVAGIGRMRMPGHWKLPDEVLLMHPEGGDPLSAVRRLLWLGKKGWISSRMLALRPNSDPGRADIIAYQERRYYGMHWRLADHLTRERFVGLLKWMAKSNVPLVGNSSAGLIECAVLGVVAFNVGPRQAGRERAGNVLDFAGDRSDRRPPPGRAGKMAKKPGFRMESGVRIAVRELAARHRPSKMYGDGRAGPRIAALLAKIDPHDGAVLRKRNSY